jgi:DNA end-binding protein Ku
MAARATSSGTISFGLVSIPVKFYTAASSEQVRFNMLHDKCGGRVKQQLYCPVDDEVIARTDTVKGYEFSKGEFVRFEADELSALEAQRDSSINIEEFVPLDCFDLIQVEKSYYLGPDKGGDKAYRLLSASMTESRKVAVGRYSAKGKEQLIVLRPYEDGLLFHQLYYADEVRSFDDVDRGATFDFHPAERQLATQLIEQLSSSEFKPEKYVDSFRTRVLEAVEQKVAGKKVQIAPEAPKAQIIDLFEALKQSLSAGESKGSDSDSNPATQEQPLPPKKAREARARKGSGKSSTG